MINQDKICVFRGGSGKVRKSQEMTHFGQEKSGFQLVAFFSKNQNTIFMSENMSEKLI